MKNLEGWPEARDFLTRELSLEPPSEFSQDWDLEVADKTRVSEFIQFYKQGKLSLVEKYALMELIIASSDRALSDGSLDEQLWEEISKELIKDHSIHDYIIHEWSLWESEALAEDFDENCFFPITPRMREVSNILKARGLEYREDK